jgi:hypothetical protein
VRFIKLCKQLFRSIFATLNNEHIHCHDDHLLDISFAEDFKQIDEQNTRRFLRDQFERRFREILDILVGTGWGGIPNQPLKPLEKIIFRVLHWGFWLDIIL